MFLKKDLKTIASRALELTVLGCLVLGLYFYNQTRMLPDKFPDNIEIGTWDWRDVAKMDLTRARSEFEAIRKHGINSIYLDLSSAIDILEVTDKNQQAQKRDKLVNVLKEYIQLASEAGIEVQALSGSPVGGNSSHRYIYSLLMNFLRDYNKSVIDTQKLTGLQLNIEPYNQIDYAGSRNVILQEYLDTISGVLENAKADMGIANFMVGFTVPFWFDGSNLEEPAVTWNEETRFVTEHVLHTLSKYQNTYLVILAYRNNAGGENGAVSLVKRELAYMEANNLKVNVLVGLETSQVEPASITFFGLTQGQVHKHAEELNDQLSEYSNFAGVAVHTLPDYLQLAN